MVMVVVRDKESERGNGRVFRLARVLGILLVVLVARERLQVDGHLLPMVGMFQRCRQSYWIRILTIFGCGGRERGYEHLRLDPWRPHALILDEEVARLPRRHVVHGEEDEAGWLLFLFRTVMWVGF
jgi:hypothetical protein